MRLWYKYLKQGLSRKLPVDKFNEESNYGRLRDNIKLLFPPIKKHWKAGLISMFVLVLSSVLTYPLPMINKYFIDDVLLKKRIDLVVPVVLLLTGIGLASYLTGVLKGFYNQRFTQEVILDLQKTMIDKVLSLPKFFFDKNRSGYLMSRISGDVHGVNWFLSGPMVQMFLQAMKFIGGVYFLIFLEWRLAIPVILTLPIPFFAMRYFAKRSYIMSHYTSEMNAKTNASLHETVNTVSLIKSFANEKKASKSLFRMLRKKVNIGYEQNSMNSLSSLINQLMPQVAKFAVMLFGAYWVISGEWQLGSLIAFQSYLSYVYGPVNQLSSSMNQLQTARATMDRVATILGMDSEENTDSGDEITKLTGSIEFDNVSFGYDKKKPVLSNLSFNIKAGEQWAVIGPSGIGKTTLISLLLKFYSTDSGDILFDDKSCKDINVRSLRRRLGYVAQSTSLQTGTILKNLKYGNPGASVEDIVKAAKIAGIHEFIEELPEKYNTHIEEGGANLSEGQKQRLSIARALVLNPDIYILDEPTASVDNLTEQSIYKALPETIKNKTTITIAHRLNTIKSAEKILFLRKNKIPLIGSHNELKGDDDYMEFFETINNCN